MRVFLIFNVLVWAPYGIYCLFSPDSLASNAGVLTSSATGVTELRAMYGGLQLALGVLAAAAVLRPALRAGAVVAIAFVTGGLALGRLAGVLLDGGPSGYTAVALVFEIGCASVAATLALRAGAASPVSTEAAPAA